MKIVNLYGGLGNVLFQVSLALHLQSLGHIVKIDTLGLENTFRDKVMYFLSKCSINLEECTVGERFKNCRAISTKRIKAKELKLLKTLFPRSIYVEKEWGEIPDDSYNYFFGYFQNINLAKKYSSIFYDALNLIARENNFVQSESEYCFIHVRRGDYCTPQAMAVHGIMTEEYYNSAIEVFDKKIRFDVYSNDLAWVRENLLISNMHVMDNVLFQYPDIVDLYRMSTYQNGIIANSTFSFWAALIGSERTQKNIVCPEQWFADPHLQKLSYKLKNSKWIYK
uniref:alpha-1,2-fucosyltransferase n=1 Tax=Pantoea sp. IMH TaxID=1267600 RepID=UPI001376560F|nr:alpha-1,2-fucosyltransferase [Pantoea sp. IMH]